MGIKKLISLCTSIIFLFNILAPSVVATPVAVYNVNSHYNVETVNLNASKTIILIQDLHCHFATQQKILDFLKRGNLASFDLYIEGLSSDINSHLIKNFPENIKAPLTDNLLRLGVISGAEHYFLNSSHKNIYALEDKNLYDGNAVRLDYIISTQDDVKKLLKQSDAQISNLTKQKLTKDVKKIIAYYNRYQNSVITEAQWLKYLSNKARLLNIESSDIAQIEEFSSSLEKINSKKLNAELTDFLNSAKASLSYAAYKELTSGDIFSNIIKLNIDVSNYKNLSRYIHLNKINPVEIYTAKFRLLNAILLKASPDNGLDIAILILAYEKFKNFMLNQASEADYKYITTFGLNNLESLWGKYLDKDIFIRLKHYAELYDTYYAVNVMRNDAFIEHLNRGKTNLKIAVMGGFHTDGIKAKLLKSGYNVTVLTPKISGGIEEAAKTYNRLFNEQAANILPALSQYALKSFLENNDSLALFNRLDSLGLLNDSGVLESETLSAIVAEYKKTYKDTNITTEAVKAKLAASNNKENPSIKQTALRRYGIFLGTLLKTIFLLPLMQTLGINVGSGFYKKDIKDGQVPDITQITNIVFKKYEIEEATEYWRKNGLEKLQAKYPSLNIRFYKNALLFGDNYYIDELGTVKKNYALSGYMSPLLSFGQLIGLPASASEEKKFIYDLLCYTQQPFYYGREEADFRRAQNYFIPAFFTAEQFEEFIRLLNQYKTAKNSMVGYGTSYSQIYFYPLPGDTRFSDMTLKSIRRDDKIQAQLAQERPLDIKKIEKELQNFIEAHPKLQEISWANVPNPLNFDKKDISMGVSTSEADWSGAYQILRNEFLSSNLWQDTYNEEMGEYNPHIRSGAELQKYLAKEKDFIVNIKVKGYVAGSAYITMYPELPNEWFIVYFAVDPLFQGKGLGSVLFDKVKELAVENKINKIALQSRDRNSTIFWAKKGFVFPNAPGRKMKYDIENPGKPSQESVELLSAPLVENYSTAEDIAKFIGEKQIATWIEAGYPENQFGKKQLALCVGNVYKYLFGDVSYTTWDYGNFRKELEKQYPQLDIKVIEDPFDIYLVISPKEADNKNNMDALGNILATKENIVCQLNAAHNISSFTPEENLVIQNILESNEYLTYEDVLNALKKLDNAEAHKFLLQLPIFKESSVNIVPSETSVLSQISALLGAA